MRPTVAVLWACFALFIAGRGTARAADTKPDEVAKIADASLRNVPELAEVRITGARPHSTKKGVLLLRGTVPNEDARKGVEARMPAVLKNARDSGAITGEFTADASRLVDQSLSRVDRVTFVVRAAAAEGGPGRANISAVRVAADGEVRLEGWVAKESWRAEIESTATKALAEAVLLKEVPGPLGRARAADMYRAPNELFRVIESSLKNKDTPELRGARLLYGRVGPNGEYAVFGLAPDEPTRRALAEEIQKVVAASGASPKGTVNADGLLLGTGPGAEMRVFEKLLPTEGRDYVLMGHFGNGRVRLTGYSENEAARAAVVDELERFVNAASVEDQVVKPRPKSEQPVPSLAEVSNVLENGEGRRLVEFGTRWVQAGRGGHQTARDGWIIRAAGHVQLGEWELAVGALRAAGHLEREFRNPHYARTIPRYQGVGRGILDAFYQSAEEAAYGDAARDSALALLARARAAGVRERSLIYPARVPMPGVSPEPAVWGCLLIPLFTGTDR